MERRRPKYPRPFALPVGLLSTNTDDRIAPVGKRVFAAQFVSCHSPRNPWLSQLQASVLSIFAFGFLLWPWKCGGTLRLWGMRYAGEWVVETTALGVTALLQRLQTWMCSRFGRFHVSFCKERRTMRPSALQIPGVSNQPLNRLALQVSVQTLRAIRSGSVGRFEFDLNKSIQDAKSSPESA